MDRNDYEIFLAVAGLGSVPAAARALGLDVASTRRRLDALESRKGVALFSHTSQGSEPTPVAMRLAMLAQSMTLPVARAGMIKWTDANSPAGHVRVVADSALMAELIRPATNALSAAHRKLSIDLAVAGDPVDLDSGEMEVVVRASETSARYVDSRELAPITLGLFAHRDYLAAVATPAAAAGLRGHSLIVQGDDEEIRAALAALELEEVVSVADIAVRPVDAFTLLQTVRAGKGIGVLRLAQAQAADDLVRVLPSVKATLNIHLVVPQHLSGLAHVRLVSEGLERSLEGLADPVGSPIAESFLERRAA